MRLGLLTVGFLALLSLAYRFYGGWIARRLALDDRRTTPAHTHRDGVDFEPTRPGYLAAQHFSAIAAAGPIAGPILACQVFGWGPCLVWIGLGVVLIGAVHDFTSLVGSVRHEARSVAEIAREHLGTGAGRAMMAFIWLALLYVVVAFADVTAASFVVGPEELQGAGFHPGGAVAAASVLYLALAVLMGVVQRFLKPPLWLLTAIFVPATLGAVWLGTQVSEAFLLSRATWGVLILVYCGVASVTPVWALLQPRGYLGGFILFGVLGLGVIGSLFGGYEIRQPAFKTWDAGGLTGSLFPFLFVTIACGACSGFHGLVCSGTTSKQIDRESHTRAVGYGAMLAEGFVAVIALTTVMITSPDEVKGLTPGTVYGNGIGRFLTLLIGEQHLPFAITFGSMAFATFVFDTLDVSTRLGRYIVQELLGVQGRMGALVGTLATLALPMAFVFGAQEGAWIRFWTLFGASNQLLAGLTLLTLAVWLRRAGQGALFAIAPMVFVMGITLWAIGRLAWANLQATHGFDVALVNGASAALLIALALYVMVAAVKASRPADAAVAGAGR
jgi:carbon starvation protein